jgi:hypothetical protein
MRGDKLEIDDPSSYQFPNKMMMNVNVFGAYCYRITIAEERGMWCEAHEAAEVSSKSSGATEARAQYFAWVRFICFFEQQETRLRSK